MNQIRQQVYGNDAVLKIFVGNINKATNDDDFRMYFEKFGPLKDIVLMKDPNNPVQNRGFGFVTPEAVEITDRIVLSPSHVLDGRDLDIKRALPKEIDDPLLHVRTTRIFLGGLPHNVTEEDLKEFFIQHYGDIGNVKEVIVKKDRQSGRPRGFCFVSFDSEHLVDKLLVENRYPVINNKRCEVRKADPGIPISGVPPSQIQKYSKVPPVPYPSRPPAPSQSRGRIPYNASNGSSHMSMGSMGQPLNVSGPYDSPGHSNQSSGSSGYGYNGYSQQQGVVGYPPANSYYGYCHSQAAVGANQQYQSGGIQSNMNPYQMQDPRSNKVGYPKSMPHPAITRGRPY